MLMKMTPTCIPCFLQRTLFEAELCEKVTCETKGEILKTACQTLGKLFNLNANSSYLATDIHRNTYRLLGTKDPYFEIKKLSTKEALKLYPFAKNLVEKSQNRLRSAILCSIVGNVLDFGIRGNEFLPEQFEANFERIYRQGLGADDTERVKEILGKAKNVLYFTDNVGEIVFDRLVCEELKKYPLSLSVVVKCEPILSDATTSDAKNAEIDKFAEILTTEMFAVGLNLEKISEKLLERIKNADLIIAKGMANYEVFSDYDYKPILYLLRSKCQPVADSLGVEKNMNVARLLE